VTDADNAAAGLTKQWQELKQVCEEFDAVYLRNQDYIKTPEIEENMKAIEETVGEISMLVRALQRDSGETKAAADRLEFYVKKYYNFSHLRFWDKSGKASELVEELTNATNAPDVATLHMTGVVANLSAELATFNSNYYEREEQIVAHKSSAKVRTVRRQVRVKLNAWKHAAQTLYEANELSDAPDATKRTAIEHVAQKVEVWLEGAERVLSQTGKNNSSSGGGNKPKPDGPNGPSTDENRPEGVPPNEDGDEPGDGGDSSDNNNGGDNNGGDSGGSDNNQDPPSGGNNGGSDKPPNPESPD
jgi:hypothetical protein